MSRKGSYFSAQKKGMALSLSVVMALSGLPTQALAAIDDLQGEPTLAAPNALAQADVEQDGTWGSCYWTIDGNGLLTVYPGAGNDTGGNSPWYGKKDSIKAVVFAVGDDGSRVVLPADSSALFNGLTSLASADLSDADTSGVKTMDHMFNGCGRLSSLDLSAWDTTSVTSAQSMFSNCTGLQSLDLSNWDTTSITNMSSMFFYCGALKSLDLSSFKTTSVTNMSYMFAACFSLKSLELSKFETSSVTNMSLMFAACSSLESLDLSAWNTSSVTNMSSMFQEAGALKTIVVGEGWNTENVVSSNSMFLMCRSLTGGAGTSYNASFTDVQYARVDKPGSPGYFTAKAEEAAEPSFKNISLTIGKQIGLDFWLDLPDSGELTYEDSFITFSIDDKAAREVTLDLSDQTKRDANGYYGFTFDETSIEMAEPVTATFHYKDGNEEKTIETTYSVQQYFVDFEAQGDDCPQTTVDLVHATANLGYYMQPYLSETNGWEFESDYKRMSVYYDVPDIATARQGLSEYGIDSFYDRDSVERLSVSASFDSLTAVNFFITPKGPDPIFTGETGDDSGTNNYQAEKQGNGMWLARHEGIRPQHLDKPVYVKGYCNGTELFVEISVFGLLNVMFDSSKTDDLARVAYASAYELWEAAQAY